MRFVVFFLQTKDRLEGHVVNHEKQEGRDGAVISHDLCLGLLEFIRSMRIIRDKRVIRVTRVIVY